MRHEASQAGSPQQWMRYAKADLALARAPLPAGGLYEQLCFHAQQAAEKSLKAILVHLALDFPNTHNVQRLIDLLPPEVPRMTWLTAAVRLTDYAVASRYPGESEPVQEDEYRHAISLAEAVVSWAEEYIGVSDAHE